MPIAPCIEWIRTFGSTHGLEHAGRIAHEFDLNSAVGAWLGTDLQVNTIAAYLVPNGYDPPLASGQSTLSAELMENSIDRVEVSRNPL